MTETRPLDTVSGDPPDASLEMTGIVKRFPPRVLANDRIDLTVHRGEIHALLGENGAGKTTLMNVLYGLCRPDSGSIRINGRSVRIRNPREAIHLGIGMVHQHFTLAPSLTVTENIILGREITRRGPFLRLRRAHRMIGELSARFGIDVDPRAVVDHLPVGIRQRVEILKVLYRQADILILDEPTSVLTPDEIHSLFQVITRLASLGKSVIFITHKLKEVMSLAHRITILRAGRVAGRTTPHDTSERQLAVLMVGRTAPTTSKQERRAPGQVVLETRHLGVMSDQGAPAVSDVSFRLRAGEVYGLAGVQGNGQTELVLALTGLRRCASGIMEIMGRDLTNRSPRTLARHGLAHVPEDRHTHGLISGYSVADNLILNTYYRPPFSRGFHLRRKEIERNARRLMQEYDIRAPGIFTPAGSLSGGNQQRLVVAREFSNPCRLLVVVHPTRGLDVRSTADIRAMILKKRHQGCAVLLVSTEMDEILALSDRVGVMFRGRIIAELEADEAGPEQLGLLMAGVIPGAGSPGANHSTGPHP